MLSWWRWQRKGWFETKPRPHIWSFFNMSMPYCYSHVDKLKLN
ncbi:hypothetical protein B4113_2534 [Geobacillus sp. B4113_201601]|nr:hypothetical protein B4113_2534 [Geobacillus sp. B4113_201601]